MYGSGMDHARHVKRRRSLRAPRKRLYTIKRWLIAARPGQVEELQALELSSRTQAQISLLRLRPDACNPEGKHRQRGEGWLSGGLLCFRH